VLGDDSSASNKFIISGGTATGTTGLAITNLGGAGASTVQDGILVVQAVNGATTSASAFSLSNPVAAGAFDYYQFKGGVTAGSHENWYLRSTLVAGSENPTLAAGSEGILPPGPGVEAPNPGATPIVADPGEIIPLYREKVPVYSAAPPVARETVLAALGTFHERRGE
jgi:autotransporter family porin